MYRCMYTYMYTSVYMYAADKEIYIGPAGFYDWNGDKQIWIPVSPLEPMEAMNDEMDQAEDAARSRVVEIEKRLGITWLHWFQHSV